MITVQIDAEETRRLANNYPRAAAKTIQETVERIGRRLEGDAKRGAPVITVNLRRGIRFIHSKNTAGVVKSFANYSKYVHGQPFYTNHIKRKETPFMTDALRSQSMFIRDEVRNIPKRALRNSK